MAWGNWGVDNRGRHYVLRAPGPAGGGEVPRCVAGEWGLVCGLLSACGYSGEKESPNCKAIACGVTLGEVYV